MNNEIFPRIAWNNALDQAILTVPAAPSHPIERVIDGFPFTRWQAVDANPVVIAATFSTPQSLDSWCCYGHNLGLIGATIQGETSIDGLTWMPLGQPVSPAGTEVLYQIDLPRSAIAIRWTIVPLSGIPEIGILHSGTDLVMPVGLQPGWTPPRDSQLVKTLEAVSRTGIHLGSTVERLDAEITCRFRDVSEHWVRQYWRPFMARCQTWPFFLHWNTALDPDGAAFCSGAEFKAVSYGAVGMMELELTTRGVIA